MEKARLNYRNGQDILRAVENTRIVLLFGRAVNADGEQEEPYLQAA